MNVSYNSEQKEDTDFVTRFEMAISHVRRLIQRKWGRPGGLPKDVDISLATFGKELELKTRAPLAYGKENVKRLVKLVLELKHDADRDELRRHTNLYYALTQLLQHRIVANAKYKNVRVLMLTDGENWSMRPQMQRMRELLKMTSVTLDCVQTTRSERDNTGLKTLCVRESNNGRFWNPLTLDDWKAVFEGIDFLLPFKRDCVFDITMSSSDDE